MDSTDFDFITEADQLPFTLDIGREANLSWEQSHFINLIYDSKEVISLHDEDISYCDQFKHSILTTMDTPVHLSHCTIPRQLQSGYTNVWIPGCARASYDHPKDHIHLR